MAHVTQLIDLEEVKRKFELKHFIETGTGLGESITQILNYGFETINSCEIITETYQKNVQSFKNKPVNLYLGDSEKCLKEMFDVSNGPSLIFLDAHFPGQGYTTHDYLSRSHSLEQIIPLENELRILSDWKHIVNSVVVIDDLRIYREGNYEGGDWPYGRELLNYPNSDFLDRFLENTHTREIITKHQGAVVYYPKNKRFKISHKNTATIGDFATSFPILSSLSKIIGPIDITLPPIYQHIVNGFKNFLEFQDFIGTVDFYDTESDFDLQCHPHEPQHKPNQVWFVKKRLESFFNRQIPIDEHLLLKVPYEPVPDEIKNKRIIIDRTKTSIIKNKGIYQNLEENYWINVNTNDSVGDSIIFNINICLQTNKEVICTPTGFPIILQFFDIPLTILQLDKPGLDARDMAYFEKTKIKWLNMT